MKIDPPLEKHEEAAVIDAYQMAGCKVVIFAQPRATMQSAGIPDLLIFDPKTGTSWFMEVKRRQGPEYRKVNSKQSPGQVAFQELCEACGVEYILGGVAEALDKLRRMGRIV